MTNYADLSIIAEIAIAFAGFAGISVVLRHETSGAWTRLENIRLFTLLTLSIPVAFFSLLPAGLAPLIADPPQVWRVSAGLCGSTLLAIGIRVFPIFTRVTNEIPALARLRLTTLIARVMSLLWIIALLLYGAVAFGLTVQRFSCYYFALLVQLLMCSIIFGRILLIRPPQRLPDDQQEQP